MVAGFQYQRLLGPTPSEEGLGGRQHCLRFAPIRGDWFSPSNGVRRRNS